MQLLYTLHTVWVDICSDAYYYNNRQIISSHGCHGARHDTHDMCGGQYVWPEHRHSLWSGQWKGTWRLEGCFGQAFVIDSAHICISLIVTWRATLPRWTQKTNNHVLCWTPSSPTRKCPSTHCQNMQGLPWTEWCSCPQPDMSPMSPIDVQDRRVCQQVPVLQNSN